MIKVRVKDWKICENKLRVRVKISKIGELRVRVRKISELRVMSCKIRELRVRVYA